MNSDKMEIINKILKDLKDINNLENNLKNVLNKTLTINNEIFNCEDIKLLEKNNYNIKKDIYNRL